MEHVWVFFGVQVLPHLSLFFYRFHFLCASVSISMRVCAYAAENVRYICTNPLSMVVFVVNLISIERCQKSLFVTLLLIEIYNTLCEAVGGRAGKRFK